jgi:hypothetical protein
MALLNPLRAAGAALALAALAGGCGDFVRPPVHLPGDPRQVLVHAVLRAGSDSADVLVSRVGSGDGYIAVSGATVRIIRGDTRTVLPESSQGRYVALIPGGVRAGEEYELEVNLSTGERVRGRTTVPAAPVPQTPAEGAHVALGPEPGYLFSTPPMVLRWAAEGRVGLRAWSSRVWAPVPDTRCYAGLYLPGGPIDITHEEMEADSARRVLMVLSCGDGWENLRVEPDSLEMTVAMTAYDENYLAHARDAENGVPEHDARGGLEGAYGVFGSAAVATRRIIAVPQ